MTDHKTRSGSLQFYPRVRAKKILPKVNWKIVSGNGILGFIGYKVGMISVLVKDDTENSISKSKKIVVPATIIECPKMKIFSVRFYKDGKVAKEVVVSNDKILKRQLKVPKEIKKIESIGDLEFDDVRMIVYSDVSKTGIKKSPDLTELALSGNKEEKLSFIKERVGKEISVTDVFSDGLVDVHGVTKGFGTQGPVKRFGITLKASKSEKGQRRPGSLAPWHPARVTFRAPQAGQTGFHTRVVYNSLILDVGEISKKDINKSGGFHKYGNIKTDYIILKGSVQGPKKRVLLMTPSVRLTKQKAKQKLEVIELR